MEQTTELNFQQALEALKNGRRVSRVWWSNNQIYLQVQTPDAHSKMTVPYIYIEYPRIQPVAYITKAREPWLPSQLDMFAEDWCIL
jgi:hypothetical protein